MSQVSYGQMTIADLTDNYQVQLSPESASFVGGTSSAKDGNITVIVSTLQGNKRIAHTIGTPTGLPTGMSVTNKTNGTASADGSFKVNVTTSLTSTNGYITIPITVDGVVYNRRFSYSVGRDGTSPTVTQTQVRYHQSTNGTTPSTIESDWVTPAPTAIAGQYMWTRTIVTYSDNVTSVSYSVSMNGEDGVSVTSVNSSKSGDETTITITLSDGTSKQFTVNDGAVGATAQWYYGDKLSHTSGSVTKTTSETATPDAVVGSMYLNPNTSLCYRCTAVDTANGTATWIYAGDLTAGVINNIEIGGRNILAFVDSNIPTTVKGLTVTKENDGWIHVSGTITGTSAAGHHLFGVTSDNSWFSANGDYTLTVENDGLLRQSNSNGIRAQLRYSNNETLGASYLSDSGSVTVNITGFVSRVGLYIDAGATGQIVDGRIRMKLEKGNIATDWTPAPEDVDAQINALDESFDQEKVFNRLTDGKKNQGLYIENGNVYLNAEMINTGYFTVTDKNTGKELFRAGNGEDGPIVSIKALDDLGAYFNFSDNGLIIGKNNSSFELHITDEEMGFYDGANKVAYINNNKLYINSAEVSTKNNGNLMLGDFAFIPQANGNLSFRKVK